MKSNKVVANFFWDKKKINLFEYCFLKSFVKNNFIVNVYSFEKIKLPKNVNLKDASKILKKNVMRKFIHQGVRGCPAAFADKFRIELMKKTKGWWFDMDMICLKKANEFKKLEKNKIIIGLETDNYVNNAVLKISDLNFLRIISKEINQKGYIIKWGEIGPKLITKLLKKEKKFDGVFPRNFFYPINFKNFNYLILPKYYKDAKKLCKKSFTIHSYNQIFNRFGIPKNILPPKGSYLHEKFLEFSPELKLHESLPEYTALRLLEKKNGFRENLNDLIPSFLRSIR